MLFVPVSIPHIVITPFLHITFFFTLQTYCICRFFHSFLFYSIPTPFIHFILLNRNDVILLLFSRIKFSTRKPSLHIPSSSLFSTQICPLHSFCAKYIFWFSSCTNFIVPIMRYFSYHLYLWYPCSQSVSDPWQYILHDDAVKCWKVRHGRKKELLNTERNKVSYKVWLHACCFYCSTLDTICIIQTRNLFGFMNELFSYFHFYSFILSLPDLR